MMRGRTIDWPKTVLQVLALLFINPWSRAILGLCILAGGLIWGLSSHQVAYVQGGQGSYQTFLSEDNSFIVFQQGSTDNYYVMRIPDYSPAVDSATVLQDMHAASSFNFIASTDFLKVDSFIRGSGAYVGQAHPIEKIVFYGVGQQNPLTYINVEYSGNPNGYMINNWPYASPLMLAGALCIVLSLLFERRAQKRKKLAAAAELAALEARPSPFARELGESSGQFPQKP